MKINRLNWFSLFMVLVGVVLAIVFYGGLPDPVPSHWNMAGEIDGWMPKPWGVWLFPAINGGLFVLFMLLPVISPKGFRLDSARRAYDIVVFVLIAFMTVVQAMVYLGARGQGLAVDVAVPLMTGILFIVLGNYLGKFPKNFFVGIRTPWTLASDEVWNRTHRLGGWCFMLAGVLIAISAFTPSSPFMISAVVLAAGVPILYSLYLYRKLHGFDTDEDQD